MTEKKLKESSSAPVGIAAICQGLQSPVVDEYCKEEDPAYLLQHWDRSRGAWRSQECSFYVDSSATATSCSSCLREQQQLLVESERRHPVLYYRARSRKRRRRVLALVLAILSGVAHYRHVLVLHENHVHFSHLSALERELYFRTELGFYYSFFKQIVQAPTLADGWEHNWVHDKLSEYPQTINAWSRFNLFPELVLGATFRALRDAFLAQDCCQIQRGGGAPPVTSCVGLGDPACFYCHGVFLWAGVEMAGFFLLAHLLAGRLEAAIAAVAAFFFHHSECTRVMWAPPLRENFSYPCFVWQQVAFIYCLLRPTSRMRFVFLTAASLLCFLTWQFAPFALTLQACACWGCHLLGSIQEATLRKFLSSIFIAHILASVIQMKDATSVTGLLPHCLISILILSFARIRQRIDIPLFRLLTGACLLSAMVFLTRRLLATLGDQDDSHIWQILHAKFDPSYRTFDTQLYLCASEFDFYQVDSLIQLTKGMVLPLAMTVVFLVLRHWESLQSDPLIAWTLLQLGAFAFLAGLIMRLKIFFTPQLILTGCLIFHPRLCPMPRSQLLLGLLLCMAISGIPNLVREHAIVGEYSNYGLEQAMNWIHSNTKPQDAFVGPMTLMATVRETTFRPVYNHPHYEDAGLRNRTRLAYSLYSRKPLPEIWRIHAQMGVSYVLAERRLCLSARSKRGCRYRDLWDLEDPENSQRTPPCEQLFDSEDGWEPYFSKVFENDEFTILTIARNPQHQKEKRRRGMSWPLRLLLRKLYKYVEEMRQIFNYSTLG